MLTTLLSENLTMLLVLGTGTLLWWFATRRPKGIPPGPWPGWPLLGHLLSVGRDPMRRFGEWRKKYGDIFSFYIGHRLVIVLNGHEVLKEAFVKHGEAFTYRPKVAMMLEKGIAGSSGKAWKEQRRFALTTLRDLGVGKNVLEEKVKEEVTYFVKAMEDQKEQKFDFTSLLQTSVANVICSIMMSKRFENDDPLFIKALEAFEENLTNSGIMTVLSFIPLIKYIPGEFFNSKKAHDALEITDEHFIKPAIEQHVKDYDENNISDFISAYIREIKIKENLGEETSFNFDNLHRATGDLLIGGADTVAATIRFGVIYLIKNPEIQEKCHQEIKETIGLERLPQMTDKSKMPYFEATVAEIQRIANVVPFAAYHSVPEDVCLRGYNIPKGAIVVPNLTSVLKDPDVFENPDEFRPERFLDDRGRFVKAEELIPFSIGKRNCIGESLSRMELFLFLATMIQRFEFLQPEDEEPPSLEATLGLALAPQPFKFVAVRRLLNS